MFQKYMSRESLIFILGIVVFVTPFLGVPSDWKRYITVAAGIIIVIVGYQLRRAAYLRSIEHDGGERHADMFVESSTADRGHQKSI